VLTLCPVKIDESPGWGRRAVAIIKEGRVFFRKTRAGGKPCYLSPVTLPSENRDSPSPRRRPDRGEGSPRGATGKKNVDYVEFRLAKKKVGIQGNAPARRGSSFSIYGRFHVDWRMVPTADPTRAKGEKPPDHHTATHPTPPRPIRGGGQLANSDWPLPSRADFLIWRRGGKGPNAFEKAATKTGPPSHQKKASRPDVPASGPDWTGRSFRQYRGHVTRGRGQEIFVWPGGMAWEHNFLDGPNRIPDPGIFPWEILGRYMGGHDVIFL